MKLDAKGRCPNCLRKPLAYKRQQSFFCHRCCRAFEIDTGEQRPNWAWALNVDNGQYVPTYKDGDYQHTKPTAAAVRMAAQDADA